MVSRASALQLLMQSYAVNRMKSIALCRGCQEAPAHSAEWKGEYSKKLPKESKYLQSTRSTANHVSANASKFISPGVESEKQAETGNL
jgi:hypothetical protein